LSKKRSKKKLTKDPIIRPTSKPPTQTVSMLEIDSAALYSAAMGSREIAMVIAKKANPPTTPSTTIFLQIPFDWGIFLSPSFLLIV
jgi:hypothetical protein